MTALLGLWRLFFFLDFLNDAYFSCYVFSGKCPYDGLIRAMMLIVFSANFPYDAYYVYDVYSGVESIRYKFLQGYCYRTLLSNSNLLKGSLTYAKLVSYTLRTRHN